MMNVRSSEDPGRLYQTTRVRRRIELERQIREFDIGVCDPMVVQELVKLEGELAKLASES